MAVHIRLDDNHLIGTLPTELGGMLTGLQVGTNRLTGIIPPELDNLQKLQVLVLDENSFDHGTIPYLWDLSDLRKSFIVVCCVDCESHKRVILYATGILNLESPSAQRTGTSSLEMKHVLEWANCVLRRNIVSTVL